MTAHRKRPRTAKANTVEIGIRDLAELLSGLQAQRGMGLLGAACPAYDRLRDSFKLFGYQTADEIEAIIRTARS